MLICKTKLIALAVAAVALSGTCETDRVVVANDNSNHFSVRPFEVDASIKTVESPEIVVKGEGSVSYDPELMVIELEVSATDPDMATSRRLFGEKSAAAIAALQKAGVSTNEITTSGLSVYDEKEWDEETKKRVFKGYKTVAEFKAVLPVEIERCERIYAAVAASRAGEDFEVSFELRPETLEKARREARRKAVANAKALAEELTLLVHGEEGLKTAIGATKTLFGGDVSGRSADELEEIFKDVKSAEIAAADAVGRQVFAVAAAAGMFKSNGDARRMAQQGGLSLNDAKIDDKRVFAADDIKDGVAVLRSGKRNYFVLRFSS